MTMICELSSIRKIEKARFEPFLPVIKECFDSPLAFFSTGTTGRKTRRLFFKIVFSVASCFIFIPLRSYCMNHRYFDANDKSFKHLVAAILTSGFSKHVIKKEKKNVNITHVVDIYWSIFDFLENPKYFQPKKK